MPPVQMQVKAIPGRVWEEDLKGWSIPINSETIPLIRKFISDWGIDPEDKANNVLWTYQADIFYKLNLSQAIEPGPGSSINFFPPWDKLFPFQMAGVEYINAQGGRVLISDKMGLGKTIQTLAYTEIFNETPALIVCPLGIKYTWAEQIKKWTGSPPLILPENTGYTQDPKYKIIHFDALEKFDITLINGINTLIIDEGHYIKNWGTRRYRAVWELSERAKKILILTATPLLNKPIELWTTINILGAGKIFGGFWKYAARYCGAKQDNYGWHFDGATNLRELNELLRINIMLSRTKEQVLPQLPEKIRSFIYTEITNREEYNQAEMDFIIWYKSQGRILKNIRAEGMIKLSQLRQLAARGKINAGLEIIRQAISDNRPGLIFGWHTEILKTIYEILKKNNIKCQIMTGQTPTNKRMDYINNFQSGEINYLLINLALGIGINLHRAEMVLFSELGWTFAEMEQAEDRAHRIGQENKVNIYYLLGSNTVDENILKVINKKKYITEETTRPQRKEELDNIIKVLTRKKI